MIRLIISAFLICLQNVTFIIECLSLGQALFAVDTDDLI